MKGGAHNLLLCACRKLIPPPWNGKLVMQLIGPQNYKAERALFQFRISEFCSCWKWIVFRERKCELAWNSRLRQQVDLPKIERWRRRVLWRDVGFVCQAPFWCQTVCRMNFDNERKNGLVVHFGELMVSLHNWLEKTICLLGLRTVLVIGNLAINYFAQLHGFLAQVFRNYLQGITFSRT